MASGFRGHSRRTPFPDRLAQRRRAAESDLIGAVERLYEQVVVPVADRQGGTPFILEAIDLRAQLTAGRDLQSRILDGLRKYVFETVTPARVVTLTRLGPERPFVACDDLVKWFFSIFDFPKLTSERAIQRAIADGTRDVLGYVSAARLENGEVVPSRPELVRFGTATNDDEIDLGAGAFILSPDLANALRGVEAPEPPGEPKEAPETPVGQNGPMPGQPTGASVYRFSADANGEQFFQILSAIQNLSDRASRLVAHIQVEAESETPFDRSWLRNAVEEQLDEAGLHWTRET